MISSFRRVFIRPRYVLLSVMTTMTVFSLVMWLPNRALLQVAAQSSAGDLVVMLGLLYGGIATNFSLASSVSVVLFAILAGLQASLLMFYIQQRRSIAPQQTTIHTLSIGGIVASVFGIGCATCGSLLATALLSSIGASALLAWLPFGGAEFGWLGVFLLAYACYYLLKAIAAPNVCPVK